MIDFDVAPDKSISHRALLLPLLCEGASRIRNLSGADDVSRTRAAVAALGADVRDDGDEVVVESPGPGGLRTPSATIDCGNSGTTARLLLGLLAGTGTHATLDGDASLRRRPMGRVAVPLAAAGARIAAHRAPGVLPLSVEAGVSGALAHRSPVASAQVKSALLIAGAAARRDVEVVEPERSRDHTERWLRAAGASIDEGASDGAWRVGLSAGADLRPVDTDVPGDFSAAAFMLALALLGGVDGARVRGVGLNPTRTGLLDVLAAMGGDIEVVEGDADGIEPIGDVLARPSALHAVAVGPGGIAALIDEVPVLAVLAARADGETTVRGAAELRVKESDRIAATCANLRALGVDARELPDGLAVRGTDAPLRGTVSAHGDHRLAMAFSVLGRAPGNDIRVDDMDVAAVSFPGFADALARADAGGTP